jgi:C-terminal processing protease CtpA/Prc
MKQVIVFALTLIVTQTFAIQNQSGNILFDNVTDALRQDYINPRGIDLERTITSYRTELLKTCPQPNDCAIKAVRGVIRNMLNSFDDAHLGLYNELSEQESLVGDPNTSGRFGFFLEATPTSLYVSDLYPETPAARAGIAVGAVIKRIDGKTGSPAVLQSMLRQHERAYSEAKVDLERGGKNASVTLRATYTQDFQPLLDMVRPDIARLRIYELGQFYFDIRAHQLIEQAKQLGAKKLILDIRYNEGGTSIASMKIAAAFVQPTERVLVDKSGKGYVFKYSDGAVTFRNIDDAGEHGVFEGKLERPATYTGSVVVLTSARTYSAGEHLADILQKTGRAKVIGSATAGGLDTSISTKMFNDREDTLYYGDRRYRNLQGQWFPARVKPDIVVKDVASGYASGRDQLLEVALSELSK